MIGRGAGTQRQSESDCPPHYREDAFGPAASSGLNRALTRQNQSVAASSAIENERTLAQIYFACMVVGEIVFLWEAFDSSKQPSYIFRSTYEARALRPGEVQFKHEVDFKHSANVDTYRLSVRRVTFADGTVWVAPQLTYD